MTASRINPTTSSSATCSTITETGKVLLVMADFDESDELATFLEFEGFDTIATDLGSIALALSAKEEPDLILIDLILDDLSAFEVSRALKSSPRTREIPRLLFTDSEAAINPVGAVAAGFSDYFCRPYSNMDLLHRINDLLSLGNTVEESPDNRSWLPSRLDRYREVT